MSLAIDTPTISSLRYRPHVLANPDEACSIIFTTPTNAPSLWCEYLDRARASYRRFGCEAAVDLEALADGAQTSMFLAAIDPAGTMVGGLRVQGPLRSAEESHALEEWRPGRMREALRSIIADRIDEGIVEVKTAWTDERAPSARSVVAQMSRTAALVPDIHGARYTMATAADHVLRAWQAGGGRVCDSIEATPYPDERYQTRLMLWDRHRLAVDAKPEVWATMQREMMMLEPMEAADGIAC